MKTLSTILLLTILFSCTKEMEVVKEECKAVTFVFVETGHTIIHWCKVMGDDLKRFQAMPRYSQISWCDNRIQELIISDDKCNLITTK